MRVTWFVNRYGEISLMRIVLGFAVFSTFVGAVSWTMSMASRPARTASEIVEKTFNGDNVIFNYELFFNRFEAIKATKSKIKNTEAQLVALKESLPKNSNDWDYNQKLNYSSLNDAVSGLKNVLQDQAAEYNADAAKINRNIFKSKDLPDHINVEE